MISRLLVSKYHLSAHSSQVKVQDSTYLFKGSQQHMGVASHLHNCSRERRESTQSADLPPPPASFSFLSADAFPCSQPAGLKPLEGSSLSCLPLPGGSCLPLAHTLLLLQSSHSTAEADSAPVVCFCTGGTFQAGQGARLRQWAWGPAQPGRAPQFTL